MRYARGAGTCPIRAESQCAPTSRDGRGRPRKAVSDEIVTSARSMLRPPVVRITRSPDAPGCSIDTSTVGAVADAGAAVGWTWTAVTPGRAGGAGARRRRECRIRSRPRRIRERAEVVWARRSPLPVSSTHEVCRCGPAPAHRSPQPGTPPAAPGTARRRPVRRAHLDRTAGWRRRGPGRPNRRVARNRPPAGAGGRGGPGRLRAGE